MNRDFKDLPSHTDVLLDAAKGLTLKQAQVTGRGIEFVFETADRRVELRILPKVYTAEKVIVDPINDLTLVVQVERSEQGVDGNDSRAQRARKEQVELPYSTWFNEGDYL